MPNETYPSDPSDDQWSLLEPHLPGPRRRGRPSLRSPRAIFDSVFCLLKSGCQWRMLLRGYPPRKTVFHYFRTWRMDGVRARIDRTLRRRPRQKLGRDSEPSAGVVDAQCVKTTGVGGEQGGFDGGKKVRGRRRHVPVDAQGLLAQARVHSAKVPDQDGIRRLPDPARSRSGRLSYLWTDAGYRGRGKEWVEQGQGVEVEVVNRSPRPPPGKVLRIWAMGWFKEGRGTDLKKLPERPALENLPRRGVAERTFAWISHNRRMNKDNERLCSVREASMYAAMTRLMARRLARN